MFSTGAALPSYPTATPLPPAQPGSLCPSSPPEPPQRPVLGHLVLPAGRRGGAEDRPALPSAERHYCRPHRADPVRPSVPSPPQVLLGTSPSPARPGPGARVDQSLVPSHLTRPPPASCGLGCVQFKGLSSLEDILVGLRVSVSRARPALVVRGTFPLVLAPAGAVTRRPLSPHVFRGSPPASPHHRLSWALQEGLGRAAVEEDSEVFGQGARHSARGEEDQGRGQRGALVRRRPRAETWLGMSRAACPHPTGWPRAGARARFTNNSAGSNLTEGPETEALEPGAGVVFRSGAYALA